MKGLAYIKRSIRNESIHILERMKHESKRVAALEHEPIRSAPVQPDKVLWSKEVKDAVGVAVSRLPPKQREAVTLVRLEDRPYAEASALMACARKTVENHVRLGMAALANDATLASIAAM